MGPADGAEAVPELAGFDTGADADCPVGVTRGDDGLGDGLVAELGVLDPRTGALGGLGVEPVHLKHVLKTLDTA